MEGVFRVRKDRCSTCLFRLHYDKQTRDRVMGEAREKDGFVQCHKHDRDAKVCCYGYYTAVGERGCTIVQLAIRFERMGQEVVEWVGDGDYPVGDDDDEEEDDDDEEEYIGRFLEEGGQVGRVLVVDGYSPQRRIR